MSLITQFWIASVATPTDPASGTIRMPYLRRLNRRLSDMTLKLREIRVEWQRTGVLASASDTHLTLQPLATFQLLEAIFAEAGLSIEQSQPGRAAGELIRQLGHLQRARVFRLPGVRRLVESRAAHTGLAFSAAAETIRNGFADAEPFYVSGRRLTEPADVFRFLLERRPFIAGLELRCPRCEHASVFAPRDLDDELRCPKCGEPFLFAPTLRGDPWRFRITGLLEQRAQHVFADDPDRRPPEAPAVLLTLVWLHDAAGGSGPLWETNLLVRGDEIAFEVDAVALELGRQGEVSLALGECRSGRGFADRDVERLERIAERLHEIGVETHLLFSTLRDDFEADEISRFRDLRDRERIGEHILPRPPILLTRRDLETTWFAATEERFHGHRRGEPARFAAASDSVYLQ